MTANVPLAYLLIFVRAQRSPRESKKLRPCDLSFLLWQEWADTVQTDIFEQVTKLKKPILHDDEEKEIREMLDDTN